jgi:hypothetical protein
MPREGHKSITISSETYEKIEKYIIEANYKAGYRKYRSISHFVEEILMEYIKNHKI